MAPGAKLCLPDLEIEATFIELHAAKSERSSLRTPYLIEQSSGRLQLRIGVTQGGPGETLGPLDGRLVERSLREIGERLGIFRVLLVAVELDVAPPIGGDCGAADAEAELVVHQGNDLRVAEVILF